MSSGTRERSAQVRVHEQRAPDHAELLDERCRGSGTACGELQVVGAERLESPGADPHDLPADGPDRAIFAAVRLLTSANMLESVPPRGVVLNRYPQLWDDEIGPCFAMIEERGAQADGVVVER